MQATSHQLSATGLCSAFPKHEWSTPPQSLHHAIPASGAEWVSGRKKHQYPPVAREQAGRSWPEFLAQADVAPGALLGPFLERQERADRLLPGLQSLLGSTTQGNGKAAELLLPQKGTCGNEECTSKNWGCIFYLLWQLSLKVFNTEIRSLYLNSCHLEKVGKNTHCAHGLSINKRNNRILDVENQEIKVIPDTCATKYTVQTNP